ncbi:hypothetical protein ACFL6C_13915 [Myxococcota bacterium]
MVRRLGYRHSMAPQKTPYGHHVGRVKELSSRRVVSKRASGIPPFMQSRVGRLPAGLRMGTRPPQQTGWNFDWDDNVIFMPTDVYLYHKETGEEVAISTHEYARIREDLGKEGDWADFEIRTDLKTGSFRNGADYADPDAFVRDVKRALAHPPDDWQGPSWHSFVRALKNRCTAKNVSIVTARAHSPATIMEGLWLLKKRGYIRFLPPLANIYTVGWPPLAEKLVGSTGDPTTAKIKVLIERLDIMHAERFARHARRLVSRSGKGTRFLHLWGFSDDDPKNFRHVAKSLGKEVKAGRWPDIKIILFYTAHEHSEDEPMTAVIQPDGTLRPFLPNECGEAKRILGNQFGGNSKKCTITPAMPTPP